MRKFKTYTSDGPSHIKRRMAELAIYTLPVMMILSSPPTAAAIMPKWFGLGVAMISGMKLSGADKAFSAGLFKEKVREKKSMTAFTVFASSVVSGLLISSQFILQDLIKTPGVITGTFAACVLGGVAMTITAHKGARLKTGDTLIEQDGREILLVSEKGRTRNFVDAPSASEPVASVHDFAMPSVPRVLKAPVTKHQVVEEQPPLFLVEPQKTQGVFLTKIRGEAPTRAPLVKQAEDKDFDDVIERPEF